MRRGFLPLLAVTSLVLLACPESTPGTPDTPTADANADTLGDTGTDATGDAGTDPGGDALADVAPDTPTSDTDDAQSDEGADAADGSDSAADATPDLPPTPPTYVQCDAGDEAWVIRTLPMLLGRQPRGIQEVRVLAQIVAQSSRETVARGLISQSAYRYRWSTWLMDELRVNRVGSKTHDGCYGSPIQSEHDGALAKFVRDHPADGPGPGAAFNMADLLFSALALDDLSVLWRAHLFAMMSKPLTGANVAPIEMDITRRQDFGEIFEATYLHRNIVCAGCHNSLWGMTDSSDPALDRHWPLPGRPELALYGDDGGTQEMTFYTMFRHLGVVGGPVRPWHLDEDCGDFMAEVDIDTDPAVFEAFFIKKRGLTANIWQVERALQRGFDKLRKNGVVKLGPNGEMDGSEAFAYLVSQRIANRVWREVMGYPLTLVHYVPRNSEQRDLLLQLTNGFIANSWSLKHLLVTIVTHPLYNDTAPEEGCGTDGPYNLPPLFNPWTLLEVAEEVPNSAGDVLHRLNARLMLQLISRTLDWPLPVDYPGGADEAFQKAVGVFVKDAEPGFDGVDFQGLLTYESRFAMCEKPTGGQPDWIDLITIMAGNTQDPTVRDVASALKNRLLSQPDLEPDEEPLVSALYEVASLDTLLTDATDWEGHTRLFCGALLQSPQFMLTGVAPPQQDTTPTIEIPEETFDAQCKAWKDLLDPKSWTITCAPGGVLVTPFAPPLGGF